MTPPRPAAFKVVVTCIAVLPLTSLSDAQCNLFRRGESNQDSLVDLSDSIFTLTYLFLSGPAPVCLDSADANDDGAVDIADAVFGIMFLFLGGAPPPAPGPRNCGADPTADSLGCASYRPCPTPQDCPCSSNEVCPNGTYCAKAEGDCDGQGACVEIPLGCPDVFDPVCGCDGRTYGNECEAAGAGVSVAHAGPCDEPCGGFAGIPCEKGEFCDLPAGECLGADLTGECVAVPEVCPDAFNPVCGCDEVTYRNDCERLRAGVQKAHDGPCEQVCGGFAGIPCDRGRYCDLPAGECGAVDLQGECVAVPEVCSDVFDPVCGCDGVTYGNDCERLRAGVQKDHDGPCEPFCGGFAGIACDRGEFCDLPAGECGGVDLTGKCVPAPDACPRIFDPVCGCDGVTYSNDCERIRAGVQKDHGGPCEQLCGGFAGIACDQGEVCDLPAGECGGADLTGECVPRPEFCPEIFDPVCGCDGVTYGNDCERLRAGVQKDHDGPCVE